MQPHIKRYERTQRIERAAAYSSPENTTRTYDIYIYIWKSMCTKFVANVAIHVEIIIIIILFLLSDGPRYACAFCNCILFATRTHRSMSISRLLDFTHWILVFRLSACLLHAIASGRCQWCSIFVFSFCCLPSCASLSVPNFIYTMFNSWMRLTNRNEGWKEM